MSEVFIDPEPGHYTASKHSKQPALVVPDVFGVLPFDGARNPMTRSNTAHRLSMAIRTPATDGQPKIHHFESEAESAVAIEALLSFDLYGMETQLPPIQFTIPGQQPRLHYFDLRLTFRDGHRRAVFVRNGSSLARRKTKDEIDAIFNSIPHDFADDAIVVKADDYTRAYRGNLRRMWHLIQQADPDADQKVEQIARNTQFWLLKDLVAKCDLPSAVAWQSAMRLIARGVLGTNWHAVISVHSRIWLNG